MMQILFGKTHWEMLGEPAEVFLDRAAADGFDVAEMVPAKLAEPVARVAAAAAAHGLGLIAQILTEGETPAEHENYMARWVENSLEFAPRLINIHTGRDIFGFEENLRLFKAALALAERHGVPIVHETHRGRALFCATAAEKYLRALPDLRINADFSHWMVVHESDLRDQEGRLDLALDRADYIHARVGFSQGPQVPHPLAPEWAPERARHLDLWRRILSARQREGTAEFVITPEFGPVPYMPRLPFTAQPLADTWTVNVQWRDHLRECLCPATSWSTPHCETS